MVSVVTLVVVQLALSADIVVVVMGRVASCELDVPFVCTWEALMIARLVVLSFVRIIFSPHYICTSRKIPDLIKHILAH